MKKPTLFFSHSSKDRDMILTIKNKLMSATGGVLDIFMSSDGQSIPFGTNWIHKIEEGLNDAKIMFVFVTENSLPSGWIYFEAGFAYNKGIKVIPVGIGVDIGALKAPLNLLQGFNITSGDSLNNFISVVNKEFEYSFAEKFTAEDYGETMSYTSTDGKSILFDEFVSNVSCELWSKYSNIDGTSTEHDLVTYFDEIITYLDKKGIQYSSERNYIEQDKSCIMVRGIKIILIKDGQIWKLKFSISPFSFKESFELHNELCLLVKEKEKFYLHIRLMDKYGYLKHEEDCAALIAAEPEWFEFRNEHVGQYVCKRYGLRFAIFDTNLWRGGEDYVLSIGYDVKKAKATDIMQLVSKLYELKLIRKKTEE